MSCVLEHLGGCQGRSDAHHVLPKQKIRREFPHGALRCLDRQTGGWDLFARSRANADLANVTLDELLADRRNLVAICRRHHELLENRRIYLDPPESAWEFARELGLEHVLEKQRDRARVLQQRNAA